MTCPSPYCCASRTGSFTGMHPPQHDGGLAAKRTVLRLVQQQSCMKRSHSAPCLSQPRQMCRTMPPPTAVPAARDASSLSSATASVSRTQHSTAVERNTAENSTSGAQRTAALGTDSRFASLSRILLVNQPGSMFRTLANRKWPSAFGPVSLLVFLFGTIMALLAAVRGALVRKVKACKCCKGFGVVRCRLCDGRGTVDWRAKFSYSEMCPLCAAKRFVVCPDCGGHYHRRLFNHNKAAQGMEAFMPAPATGVTQRSTALD